MLALALVPGLESIPISSFRTLGNKPHSVFPGSQVPPGALVPAGDERLSPQLQSAVEKVVWGVAAGKQQLILLCHSQEASSRWGLSNSRAVGFHLSDWVTKVPYSIDIHLSGQVAEVYCQPPANNIVC